MSKLISVKPVEHSGAYRKVLSWFFSYPTDEFTLNQLCSKVGISKTTGKRIVQRLMKEDFLELKKIGKLWRIKANQNHIFFRHLKIPENLELISCSGIIEEISKKFARARAIVLFGSYRKGDDTPQSDIDIAVEVLGDKPLEIIEFGTLKNLGHRKNVPVNVHVFSRKKVDINVFSNIANGIILDGFLEVKP